MPFAAPGPGCNQRQQQDLTRMNYDHNDDADLFRGYLAFSASTTVLWF